jgi:predicted ferric reductase
LRYQILFLFWYDLRLQSIMILDRIIAQQSGDVFATTAGQESRADIIKKMIEGLHYTERAISHYQATLVGVVVVFSIWHGLDKYLSSRRAILITRRSDQTLDLAPKSNTWSHHRVREGSGSSGSSTTLVGDAYVSGTTKAGQDADDRSPLLSKYHPKRTIWSRLRSFLMYQPAPVPFFNKTLPENATTLLILALFGINIFYTVIDIVWEIPLMLVFSDRASIIFAANLPWLYILGAKNQPLRLLTGYSYEHLNILHRRLGEWLCFVALLHSGSMFMVWYTFFRPDGRDLWWFLTEKTVYLGLITLFCYEVLYATSLASFRKWSYELFLGLHVGLQAGALGFLYFHHRGSKPYVRFALAIFLLDRIVFRLLAKSREFKASVKVMPDGNTVLLSGNWPVTTRTQSMWTSLFSQNMHAGWAPAEHVFLTVPSLGRKHNFQAHPFTVASAAPGTDQEHAWFDLIIRALDGFTRDLLVHAQTHSSVTIRLDGPYGSSHAFDMLRSSDVAVAIVGGSGIAVAYPMLWALLQPTSTKSQINVDPEAAGINRPGGGRRVALIWIVHQSDHIQWLGQERLDKLAALGLHVISPLPTREAGRPDVAALVRWTIQDLSTGGSSRVGVMVSGPDGMNRAARNCCAQMVGKGHAIDVAVEKFGW